MAESNPIKLCECGCGQPAPLAKQTSRRFGHVAGQAVRFIRGHHYRRHGHTREGWQSPTYKSWVAMKLRCFYPGHGSYPAYGGAGITVCEMWRDSFESFLADMGERPSKQHSIDRYPKQAGNYEPSNCRWATKSEQANNTRSNHWLTAFGETKTLSQWARSRGLDKGTLRIRLFRGWPLDKAISTPSGRKVHQCKKGHLLEGDNAWVWSKGSRTHRVCKICAKNRKAERDLAISN